MKKTKLEPGWLPRRAMGLVALGGGLLGQGLRFGMHCVSFEDNGLLRRGDWLMGTLIVLSAVILGALWVLSRAGRCSGSYTDNFPASDRNAMGEALGGALLVLGSLAAFPVASDWMGQGAALAMLVTGAAYVMGFNRRRSGEAPQLWRVFVPVLTWGVWLLQDFRDWTRDPHTAQYAFETLFCVFSMLGFYHREAFALGMGKARSAAILGWGAVFFALVTLPDVFYMASALEGIRTACLCLGAAALLGPLGPVGAPMREILEETPENSENFGE